MPYNDRNGKAENLTIAELMRVLEDFRTMYGNQVIKIEHDGPELTSHMQIEPYGDALVIVPEEEDS